MSVRRVLSLTLSAALLATPAAHAAAPADIWADADVLSDEDMADLRGGIRLPNGVDVGLGAVVTTYSNGVPILATQLTWTDAGAVVDQTISNAGQDIRALSPEALAALGINPSSGAGGVVIADANGVTALVHNVTDGALQNILINNANGRDIRQDVNVTLTLPNFEAMQSAILLQQIGLRLDADLAAAQGGG